PSEVPHSAFPIPHSEDLEALASRLAGEMRRRWQQGERPLTEEYLSAYPALGAHPPAAAELIYEEICLRRESGQSGCTSEVLRRFPQWGAPLRVMLEVDGALAAGADEPSFPEVGEVVGDFQLVGILGRGR